jgi:hypothetical protein
VNYYNKVGNSKYLEQHRNMEKLNLQAHQNAMFNTDEYVLEAILTFDKFEVPRTQYMCLWFLNIIKILFS